MGLFGGSKRTSITETRTDVTNISTGLEDIEGPAIVGSGNVVTVSDQGAFDAAESIALESIAAGAESQRAAATVVRDAASSSLEFADRAQERSFDFSDRAFDFSDRASERALDVVSDTAGRQSVAFADALRFADQVGERERGVLSDSFQFGGRALDTVSDAAARTADFSERAIESTSSFARNLFGTSLNAVTGVLREGQAQLGNTVTALNTIAREQSKSTDQRVADIASSAIRFGAIGLGLVAAAVIAMRFAR